MNNKKILFTASTMSHIENFHRPYLNAFEEMGWEVDAVALPVSKNFFSLKNIGAINYTRKLLKEGSYDVVSSHATLAGIVTRLGIILAGKSKLSKKSSNPKHGLKVFHTAHGYLFHDDKSLKKWIYLLPEIICSKVTDVLMVMNHEDLDIARKYKLCRDPANIHYINGMGIDLSRFQTADGKPLQCTKEQKESFGITDDDFVFVCAAEFSKRKNHELLLRGFAEAVKQLHQLKLILAGEGALFEEMKTLAANLGIRDRVIFLGYIKNVHELYPCCDVAVSTSRIEGLPFNIMEAMACGLPVVASDIKGHRELVEHGVNGLLFDKGNREHLTHLLSEMIYNLNVQVPLSSLSRNKIEDFSLFNVLPQIMKIYSTI